jgi:hypothetical protein
MVRVGSPERRWLVDIKRGSKFILEGHYGSFEMRRIDVSDIIGDNPMLGRKSVHALI